MLVALAGCSPGSGEAREPTERDTVERDSVEADEEAGLDCGVARGRSSVTLTVGALERSYELVVPEEPPDEAVEARPLVVTIHGYGGDAPTQLAYTGVESLAEREGFVVAAPNGHGSPRAFDMVGTRDVDFIRAVVDDVAARTCIDLDRVYATGMSNGGGMTSVLGCRAEDTFAAVAPVAAVIIDPVCLASRPIPIAAFMGTDDDIVPFDGGVVPCCNGWHVRPAPETMSSWAAHNGCLRAPDIEEVRPNVRRHTWVGCDEGAETVFYVIHGGRHAWPEFATEAIWEFFDGLER